MRVTSLVVAVLLLGCSSGQTDAEANNETATHTELFERYARVIHEAGGELNPEGRATVLGVRGLSLDGVVHETRSERVYDDLFIVLRKSGEVVSLAGSTHPWEVASSKVPDADGDGAGDVGMIRPGLYLAVARDPSRNIAGAPTFRVLTMGGVDHLPGWRDTDHDGVHSAEERMASEERSDWLSAILFHREGDGAPPAVGCQVMAKDDLRRFVEAVGGPKAQFNYVLVDASALDSGAPTG